MEVSQDQVAVGAGEKANGEESALTQVKRPPRSERKRRRYEALLAEKRENRKKKKLERKQRMKEENDDRSGDMNKKEKKALIKERLEEALKTGQRICVDCSLEDHMTDKEKGKLAMQIGRLYGANRQAEQPAHLYLTGLDRNGTLYQECMKKNDGFQNYLLDFQQNHHSMLFPADSIVYLTPDGDKPLADIDENKVYIIGGLVDESVSKNITKEKAGENGISTARLPIDEYMEKIPQESYSKVLSVNQVFEILLTYINTKDWRKALSAGVPKRKGFVFGKKKSANRNRAPRALRKKIKTKKEVLIENAELLSKDQLKKIAKNPKNSIRPSGKRKRKMLKRLRHSEKEKSSMQVETEEVASTSQVKSKSEDKTMETQSSDSEEEAEMIE